MEGGVGFMYSVLSPPSYISHAPSDGMSRSTLYIYIPGIWGVHSIPTFTLAIHSDVSSKHFGRFLILRLFIIYRQSVRSVDN